MTQIWGRLVPNQAGALWLGLIVAFVVFGDFRRPFSRRNGALLLVLAMAPLLVDVLSWWERPARIVFTAIFGLTAAYTAWGIRLSRRGQAAAWEPNLPARALVLLLLGLVLLNTAVVMGRKPDDAGAYTNLGAQRWLETGRIPYGDTLLRGPDAPAFGAAATYGPLLYVAHMPAQLLLGRPHNPPTAVPKEKTYVWPPVLATKLTCLAFHLIGLVALFYAVRRHSTAAVALGAAALYAGSPYLVGLGSDDFVIGGLRYISHIAPTAMVLLAFVALGRPLLSGALLAAGGGVLFYPAFMFPAFFGWHWWKSRRDGLRFAAGFAAVLLLLVAGVVWFTHAPPGQSALRLFLESTLEHQEGTGAREYGSSPTGFWGTHPELAAFWQKPLFGETSLFKPTFLLFATLASAMFLLARGRSRPQLAGLLAAVGAGVQLWKTHAQGSYVEWYLPLLLIALFAGAAATAEASAPAEAAPRTA
jgi:hypothetical protein